ncbi:MAG TPA: D-aminoacyl-tRNA deacylase [Thermoplasmata archaeon]|nr:D-aminoacyl-tRNA deacylase [Thermoplasmata archaeon]
MPSPYLIVLSEVDPIARAVAERWGTPEATEWHVDGAPIRKLTPEAWTLRRSGPHIRDEHLDRRLPANVRDERPTLVFPSIHRSERNVECLTVHPLGNPGPSAEVGGKPRTLVPTDPVRMTSLLRDLHERARGDACPVTFEATHHGPELELPAFFAEIGFGVAFAPSANAVRILADGLRSISAEPGDRVAVGIGGGHYVPHFTDLALRRRWAFGHLVSKHALVDLARPTAVEAIAKTPGAEGFLFARAEDARHPALDAVAPRLRDGDSPPRVVNGRSTGASRSASGT